MLATWNGFPLQTLGVMFRNVSCMCPNPERLLLRSGLRKLNDNPNFERLVLGEARRFPNILGCMDSFDSEPSQMFQH